MVALAAPSMAPNATYSIQLGDGSSQNLTIFRDEDPRIATARFCARFSITSADCSQIARAIDSAGNAQRELAPANAPQTSIEDLVRVAHPISGDLILVMANAPYEDFLNNWICHAHAVGVQHFVVLTPDAEIATRLEARGIAHHVFVPSFALSNRTTVNAQLNYGTVEYQQLILERTLLVQRMLRLGVNVIIADIDAVWLSDPSAHFHAAPRRDAMAPVDGYNDEWVCGGLVYLRNTSRTQRAWDVVAAHHMTMVDEALQRGHLKWQDESEQAFISTYFRTKGVLDFAFLDVLRFPSGRHYFKLQLPQRAGVVPAVVHNNFIVGSDQKRRRFRRHGMWAVSQVDKEDARCGAIRHHGWCHADVEHSRERRQLWRRLLRTWQAVPAPLLAFRGGVQPSSVEVPGARLFDALRGQSFTIGVCCATAAISAWSSDRMPASPGLPPLVVMGDTRRQLSIGFAADGSFEFTLAGSTLRALQPGGRRPRAGEWSSWIVSFDRETNISRIFCDGVELASDTITPHGLLGSGSMLIGNDPAGLNSAWKGFIANVRLWRGAKGSVDGASELFGHWRLDDGYGMKVRDFSANAHHGYVVGAPTWVHPASLGVSRLPAVCECENT